MTTPDLAAGATTAIERTGADRRMTRRILQTLVWRRMDERDEGARLFRREDG